MPRLVDPTAAVCTLLDPTGVSTTPAVTRSSTGIYTATVTPAIAGKFTYRWTGTGAVAAAGELYFDVRHSVVLGI